MGEGYGLIPELGSGVADHGSLSPSSRQIRGRQTKVVDADCMSYNTLSLVSFMAKSCLSETCSDKTRK